MSVLAEVLAELRRLAEEPRIPGAARVAARRIVRAVCPRSSRKPSTVADMERRLDGIDARLWVRLTAERPDGT